MNSFVAGRYLRARRKEKVISVITVISVIGVAAGVMALIISLAVNNGFQNTLQRNMLAATAHVNVLDKDPGPGMEDWRNLIREVPAHAARGRGRARALRPGVPQRPAGQQSWSTLKGIDMQAELATSDTLRHLKSGSLARLKDDERTARDRDRIQARAGCRTAGEQHRDA